MSCIITVQGVYVSTAEAHQLRTIQFRPNSYFNPVQDINGLWFISAVEKEYCTNTSPLCNRIRFQYPLRYDIQFEVDCVPTIDDADLL